MTRKPDLRRGHHRRKYTTRVEVTLDPPLYERWTAAIASPLADGMSGAAVLRSLITEWVELAEHDTCDHARKI